MAKARDETLHLRLDSELKATLERLAAEYDISVAGFVRMALREHINYLETTVKDGRRGGYRTRNDPENS